MTRLVALGAAASLFFACEESKPSGEASTPPTPESAIPAAPTSGPVSPGATARKAWEKSARAWAKRDPKAIAASYTENAVLRTPSPSGLAEHKGRAAIEANAKQTIVAFPDVAIASERVFVKGNIVIGQWVATGTHEGKLGNVEPTKKKTGLHGVTIAVVSPDGLFEKARSYWDAATTLSQIGAREDPARAPARLPSGEPEWIVSKEGARESKNLGVLRDFYAAVGAKDVDAVLGLVTDDIKRVDYSAPKNSEGHEPIKTDFAVYSEAFPDFSVEVTGSWAIGEWVVSELVFNGTHEGKLGPIAATDKPVATHLVDVSKLEGGKIFESYGYSNNLEMLVQLGLVEPPAPGATAAEPAPAASQ